VTTSALPDDVTATEDPELAQARYLVQQLEVSPIDVLVFGESTLTYFGPDEPDTRSVADLLVEALQPLTTYVVAGPGYGVALQCEYVRLACAMPRRPLVVHSLFVRGTYPAFYRHPQYGHRWAIERLRTTSVEAAYSLTAPRHEPTPQDYLEYEKLAYPTICGARVIDDFMDALRRRLKLGDPGFWRWLFEFHYGGSPEQEALHEYTDVGTMLRESGYRVIAYQNPINVVEATRELGDEFPAWQARNEQAVLDAYLEGIGEDATILRTADVWQPEDFIDPALEHLNAGARARLAALLTDEVRKVLAPRSPRSPR